MRIETSHSFLEYCQAEAEVGRVIDRYIETMRVFGLQHCAAGAWVGTGAKRVYRFYFNTWPADWLELYERNSYFEHDPVTIETRRRMTPFLMSEMAGERTFTVEGKIAYQAARHYGWEEVACFPIHGPVGYQGLITCASKEPVSFSTLEWSLLRACAVAVHDKAHASHGMGLLPTISPMLTARETECMSWVAAGKSDAEIARIIGVSTVTAHFHVEQAKRKTGARTRSEAVALLVLAGLI